MKVPLALLLLAAATLLEARGGGGGGGRGGGFGGSRGGGSRGGGGGFGSRGGIGSRGGSSARASVARGFSSKISSGISSSAAKSSGFGAGLASGSGSLSGFGSYGSTFIYISPYRPIYYGNRNYYWGSTGYPGPASNVSKCEADITGDEEFKDFTIEETGEKPKTLVWECPLYRCDPDTLGCAHLNFGLMWPVIITTIITLLIPWEDVPKILKKCTIREEEAPRNEPSVLYKVPEDPAAEPSLNGIKVTSK